MPAYEYTTASVSHGLTGRTSDVNLHGEKDGHLVIFKRAAA